MSPTPDRHATDRRNLAAAASLPKATWNTRSNLPAGKLALEARLRYGTGTWWHGW